jgi:hypothetical protein
MASLEFSAAASGPVNQQGRGTRVTCSSGIAVDAGQGRIALQDQRLSLIAKNDASGEAVWRLSHPILPKSELWLNALEDERFQSSRHWTHPLPYSLDGGPFWPLVIPD